MPTDIYLPARYAIRGRIGKNRIEHLVVPARSLPVEVETYVVRGRSLPLLRYGESATIVVPSRLRIPDGVGQVLLLPDIHEAVPDRLVRDAPARWLRPETVAPNTKMRAEAIEHCAAVRESWREQFSYREEEVSEGVITRPGLRAPQIGAVHATLAH